jgi:hypothetical protein
MTDLQLTMLIAGLLAIALWMGIHYAQWPCLPPSRLPGVPPASETPLDRRTEAILEDAAETLYEIYRDARFGEFDSPPFGLLCRRGREAWMALAVYTSGGRVDIYERHAKDHKASKKIG